MDVCGSGGSDVSADERFVRNAAAAPDTRPRPRRHRGQRPEDRDLAAEQEVHCEYPVFSSVDSILECAKGFQIIKLF